MVHLPIDNDTGDVVNLYRKIISENIFLYKVNAQRTKGDKNKLTLKEIAELANVSVSTVSKVINKKDESISEETRERIIEIVKKYHYSPYMDRVPEESRPSLILGVLIGQSADYSFLTGVVKQARARGYSTIVCTSSSAEEELQNFQILLAHHVDGILWNKEPYSTQQAPKDILHSSVKISTLDGEKKPSVTNVYFSYEAMGYAAAESLAALGHKNIGCIASESSFAVKSFLKGVSRCLFDYQTTVTNDFLCCSTSSCNAIWLQSHTGVICCDPAALEKLTTMVQYLNLVVPEEISVVGIDTESMKINGVQISSIPRPFEELSAFATDQLISSVESGKPAAGVFQKNYRVTSEDSIAAPKKIRRSHIVILGTVNVDTLLLVDKQPEPGETLNVRKRVIMPGGKGLNQSIGVSRLGASAALISALGSDYDGRQIFKFLKSNSICTDGVTLRDEVPTGHAYVFIQRNAESNISVYDGANAVLTAEDVDQYEKLFENADYCLLQTELDQELVLHAAKTAHKHHVKVILKPCAVSSLLPELIQNTDILVPNSKEAVELLPDAGSVEERASTFLSQGAGAVIITLGDRGCFFQNAKTSEYFPAARITPVDTTGAADAFIATLAFYLSLGNSIEKAIRYATCAAGLSTTRHGVPPAMVNRETLELYYFEHQTDFGRITE